jgi:hypothetical protein
MKRIGLVVVAALAGCPQHGGNNPPQVWESLDGPTETMVKLSPVEPNPF